MADELDDLPVLKKSANGGYEKIYSQGDDLPVLKKKIIGETPTASSQDIPVVTESDLSLPVEQPTPLGGKSGVSEPITLEVKPNTLASDYAANRAEKLVVEPFVYRQKQTEELKNTAVKKQDAVSKNYAELKKQEKIVNYASEQDEIKQLQQIEQQLTNMGKVTKPEDIKVFNELVAQRDALLESDAVKQGAFDKAPEMEVKNPSDFETMSEYMAYQNDVKNKFSEFDKKKKEFDEVAPNFTSSKVKDVLGVAQGAATKQQELIEKIRTDQAEADESIKAAQALNKDKLVKMGFGDSFVEGMEQTTLSNTIADMYFTGDTEQLQKSLENIYSESVVFPKETTGMGMVGETLGGQVKPLGVAISTGIINPLLGVASGSGYYGRMGVGSGLMDGYTTARSQGKTPTEAFEIAQNQAKVGGAAGVIEGVAASIPFLGKPMAKLITTPFKKAVMTAMADNGIDAVVAGGMQYAQNKNLQRLGLDVEGSRGVLQNMGAELVFGLGMHAAFAAGAKATSAETYKTIVNGLAKLPIQDVRGAVDGAVEGGFLDASNVNQPMKDIMESAAAQKRLQGVDIPEKKENVVIDLQKQIDDLEAKKKDASPAALPEIERKIAELSSEIQLQAETPLSIEEKKTLGKLNEIAASDEKSLTPTEIQERNQLRKRQTASDKRIIEQENAKLKEEQAQKNDIELSPDVPKTFTREQQPGEVGGTETFDRDGNIVEPQAEVKPVEETPAENIAEGVAKTKENVIASIADGTAQDALESGQMSPLEFVEMLDEHQLPMPKGFEKIINEIDNSAEEQGYMDEADSERFVSLWNKAQERTGIRLEGEKALGSGVGGGVMPKEISDLYQEAASLRFTLNALKQQMGGKGLVGKSKAEYEKTKTRLDNIELKLSEYEQAKNQGKPKAEEVKKEKEPKQTFEAGQEVNYYDDLFDKNHKVKILYKTGDGENGAERYQIQFEDGKEASIWSTDLKSLKETPKPEVTPVEAVKGKEIEPHKEVKASKTVAIKEVAPNHGLKEMEGGILHQMKEMSDTDIADIMDNEKSMKGAVAKKLFEKGFIEETSSGNQWRFELTQKAKDFIDAVDARLETRRAVKAGTDMFPELANIPEFKPIEKELQKHIEDGNTTEETVKRFADKSESEVKELEPIVENLERQAESDDQAVLERANETAEQLVPTVEEMPTQNKDAYYSYDTENKEFIEHPTGKPITLESGREAFSVKEKYGYQIYDAETGSRFGYGKTLKEAKQKSNELLERNKDNLDVAINGWKEKFGTSPRYAKEVEAKVAEGVAEKAAKPTKLELAKQRAAEAKKKLDDYNKSNKIAEDPEEKAKRLFEYHKALVDVAKEYIKETADKALHTVEDFAKYMGEKVEHVRDAWEEAVGGGGVKKTFVTKRAYEGKVREGVKSELEKIGLTRQIESQDEAMSKAKAFVESVGDEAALDAVRAGDVYGGEAAAVFGTVIENLDKKIATASNAEAEVLNKLQGELMEEFGLTQTRGGQFNSMLNKILNESDLGYNLQRKIKEYKDANDGNIPADVEKRFREYDAQLKDLKGKIADAEKRAKEAEEKQAMADIKEAVERERKLKKSYSQKAKVVADQVRKLKNKPFQFKDENGNVIDVTTLGTTWNDIVETVAKGIEAGGKLADVINNSLKDADWYKNFSDKDKEAFKKQLVEHLAVKQESTIGKIKVPHDLIRDLVERGIDNIEDLTAEVKDAMSGEYPDATDRDIRDAITEYGKVANPNKDEIATQIRKMKRIGRTISALEDVRAKMRPLRSGLQRDKLSAEERALNKELREAMKELPIDSELEAEQQKTALDSKKQRVQNQIEDLQREIDKGEQVPKSARSTKEDAELKELLEKRDALKKEHEAIFKDEEFRDAKRLEQAKTRAQKRIEDLQKRVREGDFSKKVRKPLIEDTELIKLNAEKLRVQEEYDKEFFKNKLQNRTKEEKIKDSLWEAWGIPRVLMATGEASFVGIQGLKQSIAHPKTALRALKNSFDFFKSEKRADEWLRKVKSQEWYPTAKKSKLAITEPHAEMTAREELYYSGWSNLIWNGLGKIITSPTRLKGKAAYESAQEVWNKINPLKAVERAAVGYLDTLRVERFLDGMQILQEQGKTFENSPQDYKDVADAINTMTGRASLGRMEQNADLLSKVFFSPRNWASGIKTATPYALYHFGKMTPTARKMAVADFSKFLGLTTGMVLMAAAKLNNDDDEDTNVEFDPRSTDFMKIRLGETRVDPWGGMQQQVVLSSRLMADALSKALPELVEGGYKKDGKIMKLGEGGGFAAPTAGDLISRQAINKLNPAAALIRNYLNTKVKKDGTVVGDFGKEYSIENELSDKFSPIFWGTVSELLKDDPTALDGLLIFYAFFGGGVNIYDKKEKKSSGAPKPLRPMPAAKRMKKMKRFGE